MPTPSGWQLPGVETEPSEIVSPQRGVFPEVWSINAFEGQSYEFKTNCYGEYEVLETCFLFGLDRVAVTAPDGGKFELEKDFNLNAYSGEVTRRWVLYGPAETQLPAAGEYEFTYYEGGVVAATQKVGYEPEIIGHPANVRWQQVANDLAVEWDPPAGMRPGMSYKVLVFPDGGDVLSLLFDWDAASGTLPDLPLDDGQRYTLNVSAYFDGGFSPSDYFDVVWEP